MPNYPERLRAPHGHHRLGLDPPPAGRHSIEERTRFDNFYIEHWSLWFDVVILLRTVAALVSYAMASRRPVTGPSGAGRVPWRR